MGRIREMVKVNGSEFWTMFDTGARNTYVVPAVARLLTTSESPRPIRSALGMQQWGIRPVPDEERLDMSHYPEEFVEF